MPQTLSELLPDPTKEAILDSMLKAAQGVGYTSHTGFSRGTFTCDGVPNSDASIRARITTAGSVGSAEVEVSADGGETWADAVTIPGDGIIASTLGVDLVFTDTIETGDNFLEDDEFALELTQSTLAVTSWQPGSVPLTLMEIDAQVMEDLHDLVGEFVAGGLLDYSTGPWLDLLGQSMYSLTRVQGRATRGIVTLSDDTGDGPHSITDGQLTFTDAQGLRFTNSGAYTLPADGEVVVTVVAERVGAEYNVANNTILTMVTPLPGVSCDNVPDGDTWITTTGRDVETDEAYRVRCKARWPAMGIGATAAGYDLWAKTGSEGAVVRTLVRASSTVPGRVEVLCAGQNGASTGPEVTAANAYIQPRVPLAVTATVAAAEEYEYTVEATVYVEAAFAAPAEAEALENLNAYNETIPLEGTIYLSKIFEALDSPEGVRNVELVDPTGDITLDDDSVAKLTVDVTFVEV